MIDELKPQLMQLAETDPRIAQGVDMVEARVANMPGVTPELLRSLVGALETVVRDPGSYPTVRAEAIRAGFAEEQDLPPRYDPVLVIAMLVVFYKLLERMESGVGRYARGGLVSYAHRVAQAGRGGDTMLAHLSPQAAAQLSAMGGGGSVNPTTGLVEFKGGLGKLIATVAPIVLSVVAPGVGTAIGTALGASAAAAPIVGSAVLGGVSSGLSGGNVLKGALTGAIGGGLGNAVGGAANSALDLGLGATGQQVLGGAITGAAQSAAAGGNALAGALGGGLGAYGGTQGGLLGSALQGAGGAVSSGGDLGRGLASGLLGYGSNTLTSGLANQLDLNPIASGALSGAVGGATRAAALGGDAGAAAQQGLLAGSVAGSGLTGALRNALTGGVSAPQLPSLAQQPQTESQYAGGIGELGSKYAVADYTGDAGNSYYDPYYGTDQQGLNGDEVMAGFKVKAGAAGSAPYASIPGTFKLAPNSQVPLFQSSAPAGSMEKVYSGLPVYEMYGDNNYVNRFINAAESGYMNPAWATYRPGVQIMASQEPMTAWGGNEAGTAAYVPKRDYAGTAPTVMLSDTSRYTPAQAANLLSHELVHINQPLEMLSTTGSNNFRSGMAQDITNTIPYLQQKYGYSGGYDTSKAEATNPIMAERMADLQGWQFNSGVDLAKDPVFQQQVLAKDPLRAALWNANTIERTTRLDPRDLTPGVITSSDFPKGQVPLSYQAQDAYRRFMNPGRTVGYAQGGLARYRDAYHG